MSLLPVFLVLVSTVLHASWNLMAHHRRSGGNAFLSLLFVLGMSGAVAGSVLCFITPVPPAVWFLAAVSGFFLSTYYLGLLMGYRSADFTFVYPVSRALPVLLLALIDALRGWVPSPHAWVGIAMVSIGCLLAPQQSWRSLNVRRYLNRSIGWIALIALSSTGYSAIDKLAAERLPDTGPVAAAHYGLLEFAFAFPLFCVALLIIRQPVSLAAHARPSWAWAATAAAFTFGAYWLVLWAYQLWSHTSYVVALRQFSIVLGVIGAAVFLRERPGALRLMAVALLTIGVALVALAGRSS